jgi:hypothetical protein
MDYKTVTKCRVCGSKKLTKYLDLGEVPLANNFENKKEYPLEVLLCEECHLSQLSIVVNPNILYSSYPYHSSISQTFKTHCKKMAQDIKEILFPEHNCLNFLALDIASNDGCLLEQFRDEGFYTMGVEPSENLVKEAESKKISTIHGFWGEEIMSQVPAADVIADLSTPLGRHAGAAAVIKYSNNSIDAVIACAGLAHPVAKTVSVNYFGVTEFLYALLPTLSKSSAPRVAITSSMASLMPNSLELVHELMADDEEKSLAIAQG